MLRFRTCEPIENGLNEHFLLHTYALRSDSTACLSSVASPRNPIVFSPIVVGDIFSVNISNLER